MFLGGIMNIINEEEIFVEMPKDLSDNISAFIDEFLMQKSKSSLKFIIDFEKVQTINTEGLILLNEHLQTLINKNVNYEIRNMSKEMSELLEIIGLIK
jgi:anti-anti-sigma regulatory factor